MKERAFAAKLQSIPDMLAFADGEFAAGCADSRLRNRMKVACEEALVNVISYAYAGTPGTIELACGFSAQADVFTVRIADSGAPYNPLEREMPDVEADISERQVGGLGVYLYTTIMDEVSYAYENGKNILLLRKHISQETGREHGAQ